MPDFLRIQVDASGLQRQLQGTGRQIRKATRNALNDTTRDAQAVMRAALPERFDLRAGQRFFERAIYFAPNARATEQKLFTELAVKEPRPVLSRFEEGDPKLPQGQALAVPTREIREGRGGHVQRGLEFKRLKPFVLQGPSAGGNPRTQFVGKKKTFLATLRKTGTPAVLQRAGDRVRVLYVFLPVVHLPKRLHFREIIQSAVAAAWPVRASQAVHFALERARRGQ